MDLSGNTAGTIQQDIATTPGQDYVLRFAMAGNTEGLPTSKQMQVWWDDELVEVASFNISGHNGTNMGWTYHEHRRTATAATTHLKFRSLANTFYGPGLDDVSLTATGSPASAPARGSRREEHPVDFVTPVAKSKSGGW